jgi:NAD(P)-dependent dehydrogenase (short-subunit alcohol dehydrogenase family)
MPDDRLEAFVSEGQKRLDGKVAVVSGAGSVGAGYGTGKATSVLFGREGAKVVLVDHVEERALEAKDEIERDGGSATVVIDELKDPTAGERIIAKALEAYGTVDILVNNAGLAIPMNIEKTSIELFDDIFAVNVRAPFMLTKAVLPTMVANGGGAVMYITSITALRGMGGDGFTAYASSKAALIGMTSDLADAYGKHGVRFNAIAPGMIESPHQSQAISDSEGKGDAARAPGGFKLADKTMLGRTGDAWDVARAVLFLCGPEGAYITGHHLPVDGGTVMRSH